MYRMLLIFSASLTLMACSLGGGNLPSDHFYRLTPVQIQPVDSVLFDQIQVRPVNVSGLLHDRAILYSNASSPLELKPYHYHYWADSPAYLLHQALYQGINSSQLSTLVSRSTTQSAPDLVINSRLLHFERRFSSSSSTVIVELEVWLDYADKAVPSWSKVYRVELQQQQQAIYSAIESFSLATQEIVQQLINDLLYKK